jgi:TonB family protein
MKKCVQIYLLLFLFLNVMLLAQEDQKNRWDVNYDINYSQEAHFPDGDQAFYSYLFNSIRYSDEAIENRVAGNAMVSFDVLPDSTISNIIVISSPGYGIDEEIVRLLSTVKFAPAVLEGKPREQNMIITIPLRAVRRN